MTDKDAVYKTKLAAEVFEVGLQFQDMIYCMQHGLEKDSVFALECFHKAVLLDPKQKYINRYVALKVRLHNPYFFNKPEDYLPHGPLVKPEWENEYMATCKAELANFKIFPSEKDKSE